MSTILAYPDLYLLLGNKELYDDTKHPGCCSVSLPQEHLLPHWPCFEFSKKLFTCASNGLFSLRRAPGIPGSSFRVLQDPLGWRCSRQMFLYWWYSISHRSSDSNPATTSASDWPENVWTVLNARPQHTTQTTMMDRRSFGRSGKLPTFPTLSFM